MGDDVICRIILIGTHLLLNGHRKSFVTRGWLDAQDDMRFTNLIFTLHPKSIDTWAHR